MTCINRKHFTLLLLPKFLQQEVPVSTLAFEQGNRGPILDPILSRCQPYPFQRKRGLQGHEVYPLPNCALGPWEPLSRGLMPTSCPSPGPVDTHMGLSRWSGGTPGPRGGGGSLVWTYQPGAEKELVQRRLGALLDTVAPGLINVKAS